MSFVETPNMSQLTWDADPASPFGYVSINQIIQTNQKSC